MLPDRHVSPELGGALPLIYRARVLNSRVNVNLPLRMSGLDASEITQPLHFRSDMTDLTEDKLSRRGLLQMAGGVTFFALAPALHAELTSGNTVQPDIRPFAGKAIPLFTAMPYLQPGSKGTTLKDGEESIILAWQTNAVPADFEVSFGISDYAQTAEVSKVNAQGKGKEFEGRVNHTATLRGLKLGQRYQYRVTMNGERLLDGFFTTRKGRGTPMRFVSFGDNSFGDISDRAIAFEAYRARPDFVMNTGDLVYDAGLDNEYARYFFPVYNADEAGRRIGAPLLRTVPLYSVIANHDVEGKDENKHPVADFKKSPDSLGYYTNLHLPGTGPDDAIGFFKKAAGDRFPSQANYSFDYGDAHFTCLDSNIYVDPTDPALQAWVEQDLASTDAIWKFVVYHHPAFNVGHEHYTVQHMRVLTPIFEKYGVAMVLSGHEHNYQRTRPIKFVPRDVTKAKTLNTSQRQVPGDITVDRNFDGKTNTKADGILHITTGAGGKDLYDPEQNGAPGTWLHEEDANADYVVTMISDRHFLTVIDIDGQRLTLRQVDEWGNEIDHITLTR